MHCLSMFYILLAHSICLCLAMIVYTVHGSKWCFRSVGISGKFSTELLFWWNLQTCNLWIIEHGFYNWVYKFRFEILYNV